MGRRALLRAVHERIAAEGTRVSLWPSVATPKRMVADLAEQVHAAIGLEVPERLIPTRFRATARRSGVIEFRHIRRTLTREPVAEQLNLVLTALAQHSDMILFVESLEIPPTQAEMLHRLAEHLQIAAAVEDGNRRNRIQRLLWRFQLVLDLKPLIRAEVRTGSSGGSWRTPCTSRAPGCGRPSSPRWRATPTGSRPRWRGCWPRPPRTGR